ncbi:hypothetical protein LINGRAHAP2_LOCUS23549, partial [Linum grandiflorum]
MDEMTALICSSEKRHNKMNLSTEKQNEVPQKIRVIEEVIEMDDKLEVASLDSYKRKNGYFYFWKMDGKRMEEGLTKLISDNEVVDMGVKVHRRLSLVAGGDGEALGWFSRSILAGYVSPARSPPRLTTSARLDPPPREIGPLLTGKYLRRMVGRLRPSTLFLMETKHSGEYMERKRALLNYANGFYVNPIGTAGDCNAVLYDYEKEGGNPIRYNSTHDFENFIFQNGLIDLGFIGDQFTWTNCKEGHERINERLDRALCTAKWRTDFDEAMADHDSEIQAEMDIKRRLEALTTVSPSRQNLNESKALTTRLNQLWDDENMAWHQRSMIQWDKDGDCNTRFFHSTSIYRRNKNYIGSIQDEYGNQIRDTDRLAGHASNFYRKLFTARTENPVMTELENLPRLFENRFADYKFIARKYIDRFMGSFLETGDIIQTVQEDLHLQIGPDKAGTLRRYGVELARGKTEEQYARLYDYCAEVPCKEGFLAGCMRIICIDGCFLKTLHGGQLLTAVGLDGNDGVFPIAYAM